MNKLPKDFTLSRYGLNVRFVNEEDAEFIVKLRTDEKLGRFINATSSNVNNQIDWIRAYKLRECEGTDYYFMFENAIGERLGVCRLYDITNSDFTIGSWLFKKDSPMGAAILADIITREIGFELYPDKILLFDVKIGNINVNRYQATYHPNIIKESDDTRYYRLDRESFNKYKKLHLRMFKITQQ